MMAAADADAEQAYWAYVQEWRRRHHCWEQHNNNKKEDIKTVLEKTLLEEPPRKKKRKEKWVCIGTFFGKARIKAKTFMKQQRQEAHKKLAKCRIGDEARPFVVYAHRSETGEYDELYITASSGSSQ